MGGHGREDGRKDGDDEQCQRELLGSHLEEDPEDLEECGRTQSQDSQRGPPKLTGQHQKACIQHQDVAKEAKWVVDSGLQDERRGGRCKQPVGSTVDVANATFTNAIGDSELITAWRDPDFDPKQRAVYYARVLEIPTPRWTAYEARYYDLDLDDDIPMVLQERAYTSPIWYTP